VPGAVCLPIVMTHIAETAGRIMTTAVPVVDERSTVADVEALLRREAAVLNTINYIYVTGAHTELVGVLSVRELFSLPATAVVGENMQRAVVTVRAHTDQERVAHLALTHNLKAVPVVSKDKVLLGVVPSDVILTVLNQEHTEDVLRFAGVKKQRKTEETGLSVLLLAASPLTHVKARLPWLLVGLLGGVGAAFVVGKFEATLAHELILAAFIPAVVYMADAVGSQTQMLFIRSLALEHNLSVRKYLWRELRVNLILGLVLAGVAFVISYVWLASLSVSSILSLSLFLTVWCTVLIAIALPWYFHKFGYDPAIASGPLATVVRDIISLLIYLGVASVILG